MGFFPRTDPSRGWMPDADASQAPLTAALRADNLILDELGVFSLRQGMTQIESFFGFTGDVHSLYTEVLSGTRYRFVGIDDDVFANGSLIRALMKGSGDIAFGGHLGQVLFARGSSRYKSDGGAAANWGLPMTGTPPTISSATTQDIQLATFDSGESPAFVANETAAGISFVAAEDNTASGAIAFTAALGTNRGVITRTLAAETDFTTYSGGQVATDDDLLALWVYINEPTHLIALSVQIDVNGSSTNPFQDDYYTHDFTSADDTPIASDSTPSPTAGNTFVLPEVTVDLPSGPITVGGPVAAVNPALPVANAGWSRLQVRRGDMTRVGSTTGKGWSTVKGMRVVVQTSSQSDFRVDDLRFVRNPLVGAYKFLYVLGRDTGSYVGLSAPSTPSVLTQVQGSATVTIPSDPARDPQANVVWVYRFGGVMTGYFRTATAAVTSTGAINIVDELSDLDALILNLPLQTDNVRPPENIIDIEGPYFDRVFALTSDGFLWPSRTLNPDSFATGQVIRVAAAEETAYWVKRAFGGLYIGTSKDIYRLEGTGAELPDGTIDFIKRPLNVDHPPVTDGIAQEGNLLVYVADDGWRAFSGEQTASIVGETSLLYRGYTRHGVSPVNLATGRFRAAIAHGQLAAITPEGTDAASSPVLYRHAPKAGAWYRHTYTPRFRSIFREPGGTLIAGDTGGFVWQLDTGTEDNGTAIPIVLWTKADDYGAPFARKEASDLHLVVDTGGGSLRAACHLDESDTSTAAVSGSSSGQKLVITDIRNVGRFRQLQLRLTGSFSTFRYGGHGLSAVLRPIGVKAWDSGPLDVGTNELVWIRHFLLKVNAAADLAIAVWFDGELRGSSSVPVVTNGGDIVVPVGFPRGIVGRQPRLVITSAAEFLPYWVEVYFRNSGRTTDKNKIRVPITVGGVLA